MVICIHCLPSDIIIRPFLRSAVPLFFLMTSYFFFFKIRLCESEKEERHTLMSYVKRTMNLYLFWFVVFFPLTIIYRKWYQDFNCMTPLIILRDFLFGSTFKGSWFLMASVIDVILVWYLWKYLNKYVLLLICVIAYVFSCLASNYYYSLDTMGGFFNFYQGILKKPYNSFPVGLIFVFCGRYLAETRIIFSRKTLFFSIMLSLLMLILESTFVKNNGWVKADDTYFCLLPFCLSVFISLGQWDYPLKTDTRILRNASTIFYCSHISIYPH